MNSKWIFIGLTLVLLTFVIQESASKSAKKKDSDEEEKNSDDEDKKKDDDGDDEDKDKDKDDDEDDKKGKKDSKNPFKKGAKCQGKKVEFPKEFTKAHTKCEEETNKGDDNEEAKTGEICETVCIFNEMEFFTGKAHKVDSEAIDGFIDQIMTGTLESGREAAKKEWKACKKEIGDADDEDDKKCKRYKKYFGCIIASRKKLCDVKATPKPKFTLLGLGR